MRGLRIIVFLCFFALAFYFSSQKSSRSGRTKPPPVNPPPTSRAEILAPQAAPERGTPIPAGNLFADTIHFEFGIYVPGDAKADGVALLQNSVAKYKALQFVPLGGVKPTDSAYCELASISFDQYKPPDDEALKYLGNGLSDAEKKALTACKQAIVVNFTAKQSQGLAALKDAQALMLDLANETNGFLWDESARVAYSREKWKAQRVDEWTEAAPDLMHQMEVHFYQNGEFCRLVSLGMEKFGLPDLSIEDCTRSDSRSLVSMMNLVSQTMLEKGNIDTAGTLPVDIEKLKNTRMRERLLKGNKSGATGKAAIQLALVPAQEGDAKNRLLEIHFPASLGKGVQERQTALIQQLFGGSDGVKYIEHNAEVLAARDRATEKLKQEFKLWKAGLPPGDELMVKAPFSTPNGKTEWMWVEVTQWNDDGTIQGVLANDPFEIPNLKAGAKVKVRQDALFDYIHYFADGHKEGNETGKIIEKMEGNKKSK